MSILNTKFPVNPPLPHREEVKGWVEVVLGVEPYPNPPHNGVSILKC